MSGTIKPHKTSMPGKTSFPHLHLAFKGTYQPKFQGGRKPSDDVKRIRQDPRGHAGRIRGVLGRIRQIEDDVRRQRQEKGLPPIPADKGFLLKLPEGVDVEAIAKALGVELVAETEEGLMLVSSEDIAFAKLEEVLAEFETGTGSLVAGSSILDIYEQPDDERRLRNILAPEVLELWPFTDKDSYTLDLGIQTASSTRSVHWPRVKKKKDETDADFQRRREEKRREAWVAADEDWQEKAKARVNELHKFIQHYRGEIISGMMAIPGAEAEHGVIFPDSVQVRVRMSGLGFRDIILNFAHLFDVTLPPELQHALRGAPAGRELPTVIIRSPGGAAAAVCVIDSGIQEEHRWLDPAIDKATSRCFLPGTDPTNVADYYAPQGHGTRVAGAVLYPRDIPKSGDVEPIAWIQNARVLDGDNQLPDTLPPEKYLQQVVAHFHSTPRFTKIFNHSINARVPCPKQRMTAWASKIDQLSHEKDVLFIQPAGNQDRLGNGDQANPGLSAHLDLGRQPPQHLLEPSMRVANPAQSLHALTVGSVSEAVFQDAGARSFAANAFEPSGFSRAGYGQPWSIVKPEVVELGGDLIYSRDQPRLVRQHPDVAVELLNSTLGGAPAYSKDGAGTSFAAPKVAHIAARLQNLFPCASPLLYRALIVQSARWPGWAEVEPDTDKVLRLVGYGFPSVERASTNSETRVTLITPEAEIIPSKQLHLYTVRIPEELRNPALEALIRIDVTLAYTALPRRTRGRRTGYLETWLDWESSKLGEPVTDFLTRMQNGGKSNRPEFAWTIHKHDDWGEAQETNRNRGSVQKDWAVFNSFDLPEELGIAVRAHKGWNHLDGAGCGRYCLVVSFEALSGEVPIYSMIESAIEVREVESEVGVGL